jgi:putative RecB family exonuclease
MALQATCYINAVQERYGEPVSLNYVVLVKTKTPQVQRLTTDRTESDLGRLGDTVQSVQRAIEAGAFYPVENPMNCSGCPYRGPCKEWQGDSGFQGLDEEHREGERC